MVQRSEPPSDDSPTSSTGLFLQPRWVVPSHGMHACSANEDVGERNRTPGFRLPNLFVCGTCMHAFHARSVTAVYTSPPHSVESASTISLSTNACTIHVHFSNCLPQWGDCPPNGEEWYSRLSLSTWYFPAMTHALRITRLEYNMICEKAVVQHGTSGSTDRAHVRVANVRNSPQSRRVPLLPICWTISISHILTNMSTCVCG